MMRCCSALDGPASLEVWFVRAMTVLMKMLIGPSSVMDHCKRQVLQSSS
jgi:hypothetical protein